MGGEGQWVIGEVSENRKEYLDLLLLADEQENMIDRYLDRGWMYVMKDRSGDDFRFCRWEQGTAL